MSSKRIKVSKVDSLKRKVRKQLIKEFDSKDSAAVEELIILIKETQRLTKDNAIIESKNYGHTILNLALIADSLEKIAPKEGKLKNAVEDLVEVTDFAIALYMRNEPSLWATHRIKTTGSSDLLIGLISKIYNTKEIMESLDRYLILTHGRENGKFEVEDILGSYAYHVYALVAHLNALCDKYPEETKNIGSDYPNWPYLMFDRRSTPSDFHDLAQKIGLGKTCVINTDQQARYHFSTALNVYVFSILTEWQDIKRFIGNSKQKKKSEVKRLIEIMVAESTNNVTPSEKKEANIFYECLELPPLTQKQSCIKSWADKLIMPLILHRENTFEGVPAFETAVRHAQYQTRNSHSNSLRKLVIRSLKAMAKPGTRT